MDTKAIAECMTLSFANTPFPVIVQKLAGAGVHGYRADLIKLRNTYYNDSTAAADEALPLTDIPTIAARFDGAAVAATIQAIQQKKIGYADFLRQIMAAGCASYSVFFDGGKTMYFGRDGEHHVEPFPARAQ